MRAFVNLIVGFKSEGDYKKHMGNVCTRWSLRRKTVQNTKNFDLSGRFKICKILYIHDGDTVTVAVQHRSKVWCIQLRMFGINAPELRVPENTVGRNHIILKAARAREALREKILNKFVLVEFHEQDKYGRWLATIYLCSSVLGKKKENVNEFMLSNGHAVRYFEDTQVIGPTDFQMNPNAATKNSEDFVAVTPVYSTDAQV